MENHNIVWDFFIAHAKEDTNIALELFNHLTTEKCKVFLDKTSISLGEAWDEAISDGQEKSLITVVLVSDNISKSHYGREEIQKAIALARSYPNYHKVIPVFLTTTVNNIPYGLKLLQGMNCGNMQIVAKELLKCLGDFKANAVMSVEDQEQHILLSFPGGPMVTSDMIPKVLIEAYSSLIREVESKGVVSEANAFRREASPDTNFIIPLHKIPSPDKISAYEFWQDVFDYARLQGPRMVAALLMVVPDDQFDDRAKTARRKLLEQLKNYSALKL